MLDLNVELAICEGKSTDVDILADVLGESFNKDEIWDSLYAEEEPPTYPTRIQVNCIPAPP